MAELTFGALLVRIDKKLDKLLGEAEPKTYPQGIDRLMEFVFDPKTALKYGAKRGNLAERRKLSLDVMAKVIEEIYGPRCSSNEGGCMRCTAWAIFDCIERLTDATP